jgi:hypothetical protein
MRWTEGEVYQSALKLGGLPGFGLKILFCFSKPIVRLLIYKNIIRPICFGKREPS